MIEWITLFGSVLLTVIVYLLLLWKKVYDTELTVAVANAEYAKSSSVAISGSAKTSTGSPLPGTVVSYAIAPPSGSAFGPFTTTTGTDGKFNASWIVPATAVVGVYTLTATAIGKSAVTTFMQGIINMVRGCLYSISLFDFKP